MKVSEKTKKRNLALSEVNKKERDKIEIAEILKHWEIRKIAKTNNKVRVEFVKRNANPKLTQIRVDIINENPDIFTPEEVALILGDS